MYFEIKRSLKHIVIKYKVVVEILKQEILDGIYNETRKLPTEDELMKKFDMSRNTIRKAIEVLVGQGYIYQVQGSGIFLREFSKPGCVDLNSMNGLTRNFSNQRLSSKLIDLTLMEADQQLAIKMKCKVGTKLYHVKRVRLVDDEVYCIEESYFNKDIIPYLNEEICSKSIYQYIAEDLKLKIGFADKVISCNKLDDADAKFMNLSVGDPTLIIENTVFLNTGIIFDFSTGKYNYKNSKLLSLATL